MCLSENHFPCITLALEKNKKIPQKTKHNTFRNLKKPRDIIIYL